MFLFKTLLSKNQVTNVEHEIKSFCFIKNVISLNAQLQLSSNGVGKLKLLAGNILSDRFN